MALAACQHYAGLSLVDLTRYRNGHFEAQATFEKWLHLALLHQCASKFSFAFSVSTVVAGTTSEVNHHGFHKKFRIAYTDEAYPINDTNAHTRQNGRSWDDAINARQALIWQCLQNA